jgi:hypothetical protein
MSDPSVYLVGCSVSNFAGAAYTFREPSLYHHVHRALMRSALLDLTPIIPQLLATKEITSRDTVGL